MSQTTEPYRPRHDENPQCDHQMNPDTAEVISADEDALEVEGKCLHCEHYLYEPINVDEMSVYERGT